VGSTAGLLHLISACWALISGSYILWAKKGTQFHNRVGYFYVAALLLVNGTALSIYHLFGTVGIFHFLAFLSLTSVFLGMVPMLMKWKNGLNWHINQMYFSVIGLYAAFFGETAVRLPFVQTIWWFWIVVAGAAIVTMFVGTYVFLVKYKSWKPERVESR
jgi:uncharacterized membrane protein